MPRPKPSTPQLLLITVRSLTPLDLMAAMRNSGMPQRPKPPAMIVMPSNRTPSRALSAFGRIFFIIHHLDWGKGDYAGIGHFTGAVKSGNHLISTIVQSY